MVCDGLPGCLGASRTEAVHHGKRTSLLSEHRSKTDIDLFAWVTGGLLGWIRCARQVKAHQQGEVHALQRIWRIG